MSDFDVYMKRTLRQPVSTADLWAQLQKAERIPEGWTLKDLETYLTNHAFRVTLVGPGKYLWASKPLGME